MIDTIPIMPLHPSPCFRALVMIALTVIGGRAAADDVVVIEHDNTVIRRSCTLALPATTIADADGNGVILIEPPADGGPITVDLGGGTLTGGTAAPDTHAGIGIAIRGAGVTLRNGSVRGFKVGIHAESCDGLVLEDLDTSGNYAQRLRSTPLAEFAGDWLYPHHNDGGEWVAQHGAGVSVRSARNATIRRVTSHGTQNGLVLDRVTDTAIYDNDCSFLSGWGVAMWRSSRNTVCRNRLVYCIRGYSHGVYNRGQDSAGLLMFEQCCDNLVALNSITHGGDGVFGFAGREALGESPCPSSAIDFDDPLAWYRGRGCSGNTFARNDLSFAAAHGLEMTFSSRNLVYGNTLEGNAICGIWGGYARDSEIVDNDFRSNGGAGYGLERGGANLEHAQRVRIMRNRFADEPVSVHFWTDADEGLRRLPWAKANGAGAADNMVLDNSFTRIAAPIELRGALHTLVGGNRWIECSATIVQDDACSGTRVLDAARTDGAVRADGAEGVTEAEAVTEAEGVMEAQAVTEPEGEVTRRLADLEERLARLPGTRTPTESRVGHRGRADIVMGEFAPWNHRDLLVVPAPPDGAGGPATDAPATARFRVLGSGDAPSIAITGDGIAVRPLGVHPDGGLLVEVHAKRAGESVGAALPFTLSVARADGGSASSVDGLLLDAVWDTRIAVLDREGMPRLPEVPTVEDILRRTTAPDAVTLRLRALDLDRSRGGPRQLAAAPRDAARLPAGPDRYCLTASATLRLTAGRWRLVTESDDGVRVRVDGQTVIERWDIHGPTTDSTEWSVDSPRDVTVELAYFQNSGAARLSVRLERVETP